MKYILLSLSLLLSFMGTSQQVTNLNDSGPGSLRQAIISASSGATITFSPSLVANGVDTIHLQSELIINKSLNIIGPAGNTPQIVLSGGNQVRIAYIDIQGSSSSKVAFENLFFFRGYPHYPSSGQGENGGGVNIIRADSLILDHCLFQQNKTFSTGKGGAVCMIGGYLVVRDSYFTENEATSDVYSYGATIFKNYGGAVITHTDFTRNIGSRGGGAIYCVDADLRAVGCDFLENRILEITNNGSGAIRCTQGVIFIDSCVFRKNSARLETSAIYLPSNINDSPVRDTISNCLIDSNYLDGPIHNGGSGGAILASKNTTVYNCTISNNRTLRGAGGIRCGRAEIKNCTIINNQTSQYGGSGIEFSRSCRIINSTITGNNGVDGVIYGENHYSVDDTLYITNSIVAGNTGGGVGFHNVLLQQSGYNIIASNPAGTDSTDIVNFTGNLNLLPLGNYGGFSPTAPPDFNSIAFNAGDSTDLSNAQNGPLYGRRDIGAAEGRVIKYDTTLLCGTVTWWGNTYSQLGTYTDTAYNSTSLDSVGVLVLYNQDTAVVNIGGTLTALEQHTGTSYQWVKCDSNYAAISGATDTSFTPTSNGSYAVVLTNGNCSDTSSCVLITGIGLAEVSTSNKWLSFYPNPTRGEITISTSEITASRLTVFDLYGRIVYRCGITEPIIRLNHLASGVYLLQWESEEGDVQVDRAIVR